MIAEGVSQLPLRGGEVLKYIRGIQKLSLRQAVVCEGERIPDLYPMFLSQIETGRTNSPSLRIVGNLSLAYRVSPVVVLLAYGLDIRPDYIEADQYSEMLLTGGGALRRIRNDQGVSLKSVEKRAADLGTPIRGSSLSEYESGRIKYPLINKVAKLALAYGVNPIVILKAYGINIDEPGEIAVSHRVINLVYKTIRAQRSLAEAQRSLVQSLELLRKF